MLISLLPFKSTGLHTIDARKVHTNKSTVQLLPVFVDESSLGQKYRNAALGRWLLPVTSNHSHKQQVPPVVKNEDAQNGTDTNKLVDQTLEALKSANDPVQSRLSTAIALEGHGQWMPEPEYTLRAQYGQALFPLEPSSNKQSRRNSASESEVVFTTGVPGLSTLLNLDNFEITASNQMPNLVYDFIPSPEQQDFNAGEEFPKLRIQVRTKPSGGRASLHRIQLHFHKHVHDVVLPNRASDIRFAIGGRLIWQIPKGSRNNQVQRWFSAVCKNIESGARLTAPSLTMDIPGWTLPGGNFSADGMRSVKYLFSGVRLRQSVSGTYENAGMSYSASTLR